MAAKKPIPAILQDDPDDPDLIRAVSIGLGVLRHTKQRSWADLAAAVAAAEETVAVALRLLVLTPDQFERVERHESVLRYIRWGAVGGADRTVTVAACERCGRWLLTTSTVPGRCQLSTGCDGAMMKATPARKTPARPDDLAAAGQTTTAG